MYIETRERSKPDFFPTAMRFLFDMILSPLNLGMPPGPLTTSVVIFVIGR